MIDYILQYAPYALIILNAVFSIFTYRRTGKVVGYSKDNPVNKINEENASVNENWQGILYSDIQAMIDYHKKSAEELEKTLKGGENNG